VAVVEVVECWHLDLHLLCLYLSPYLCLYLHHSSVPERKIDKEKDIRRMDS